MPDSTDTSADFALLRQWRSGDALAADALVRRHYSSILRFFEMRTRNAEDLTQRTFLACVEGQEAFRGDASFRTYVFSIARRLLMKHLAEQHSAARLARFDAVSGDAKTTVSALLSRKQEQQILLAALSTLPEQTQTILVLHYWENLRSREIAEVLEVPTSTITTRLSRARGELSHRVEQLATGRAGAALLSDLETWTRSLAADVGLDGVASAMAARLAQRRG